MRKKSKKAIEIPDRFSYENEYWAARAGASIVDIIESETGEEDYSINRKHIFKLQDGNYAVVSERGCSCYSMADASITICSTLKQANTEYNLIEL